MQSADRLAIDPPISYDQDFYAWTQQMAIALRQKNWTYPYPSCKGAAFSQIFLKMAEK